MSEPDSSPSAYVQSLARGLAVITAFDEERPAMTLTEIAKATGLTRATSRRFLLTLQELGYVRSDGRQFMLTPRVLELGYSYLSGIRLPEIAQPHLELLSHTVHESTSMAVLDADRIVYVARVPTRRIMTVGITIGTHFPAFATSMGRVLLAGLPADELDALLANADMPALTQFTVQGQDRVREVLDQTRSRGWALVDQELEVGLRSLAVPVLDRSGSVAAAINVSTHVGAQTVDETVETFLPALFRTADQISADLRSLPSGGR